MHRLAIIFFVGLLIFSFGCNFSPPTSHGPSNDFDTPPSPDLMQYAEDLTRGWNARLSATSSRTEIDDLRNGVAVHMLTESSCPDRYHVVVTGAESSETYYIGTTMYKRTGNAPWIQKKIPMPYRGLGACNGNSKPGDIDPSRIRLVAEQLRGITLSKPVIREFHGRKCREWTRTFTAGKSEFKNTNCYDVNSHELVRSVIGTTSTTYFWNVPVDIKPPK